MRDLRNHGLEPHPVLYKYYPARDQRLSFVRALFNQTAPHYDGINRLFSLGQGAGYRRRCLLRNGLRPGHRVIDVAIGTGLLAREAVAITGDRRNVVGVDLSEGMLRVARDKLGVPLIQGTAEQLPIADGVADFVTMGYALRHVSDLVDAFREFRRVLRRGGTVLALEIGRPTTPLRRMVASAYLGQVVPFLCRWGNGRATLATLTRYYWETIDNCVPAEAILGAMREAGFPDPQCIVDVDLFRSFVARNP